MGLTRPKAKQINFDVTNISDPLITLNKVASPPANNTSDGGLVIVRGTGDSNVAIIWDESADQFAFISTSEDGTTTGNVSITAYADLTVKTLTANSGLAANSQRITGVGAPVAGDDAATKTYVDGQVSGASYIPTSEKAAALGVATLGADSKIVSNQLPAIAITDSFVAADQTAMLALTAQTGDVAVRSDLNETFILQGTDPSTLGDWLKLLTPTGGVLSVNSQTGAVVLTASDVGAIPTSGGSITGDITPSVDSTTDLGTSSLKFNTVHAVTFSGTATTAKYADVAEKYIADAVYEPGTVLVFGGEHEVTECLSLADKKVIGIVSTNPAYLMNTDLGHEYATEVALLGRVPCKVMGKVLKGEMIVSSALPGHGEAWDAEQDPSPSAIIGKAVSDKMTLGPGMVEVLVGRI